MDLSLIADNVLSPPILFFFCGVLAVFCKSDLEIPQPLPKLFSLYLLFAIGFHGGVELNRSGINPELLLSLGAAMFLAVVVPIYSFFILRLKMDVFNAGAIAATYGSISAVTFITAGTFLTNLGISYGGHYVAAMALMESPAIIIGVMLVRWMTASSGGEKINWKELSREAFFNGSVFLLMGSLVIGLLTGDSGWDKVKPFTKDIFQGMLCLFLLDMGIVAARRLGEIRKAGVFLISFALAMPLVNGTLGILLSVLLGLDMGGAFMLTVLGASASYIAVPAAVRLCIPEANPSIYVTMSLAITFPFNIIVGLPLYLAVLKLFMGA